METPLAETYAPSEEQDRFVEIPPASPPKRAVSIRTISLFVIVLILVLGGGIWGFQQWKYGQNHVSTDDAQMDGDVVPVSTSVGGYVASVHVHENDSVVLGQELVTIDDTRLRARVAAATAELDAAKIAAGSGSKAGVEGAQRTSSAMAARIEAARADAEQADHDLERTESLAKQEIVSKQELDAARTASATAHATVRAMEQQLAAAESGVSGAQSSERLAQAKLEAAQAELDLATLELSHTHITAPASGTVARLQVDPGQLLQEGQPLMAIVADSSVRVTANFKETDLGRLREGQVVDIDVDAYPDCSAIGSVDSFSPATGSKFALLPPDNATGNFTKVVQRVPVRIRLVKDCGPDEPLKPGLSVTVHVRTGE